MQFLAALMFSASPEASQRSAAGIPITWCDCSFAFCTYFLIPAPAAGIHNSISIPFAWITCHCIPYFLVELCHLDHYDISVMQICYNFYLDSSYKACFCATLRH